MLFESENAIDQPLLMIIDSLVLNVTAAKIKIPPVQPVLRLLVVLRETRDSPHPDNLTEIATDFERLGAVKSELVQ